MKNKIFCTLGPSSLNRDFLKFTNKKVDLLRLNMSHIDIKDLQKNINFVKRFSSVPICIDTEGAQIRSKVRKKKFCKKGSYLRLFKKHKSYFSLYPPSIFEKIKIKDILDIGFEGLKIQILQKNKENCKTKVIKSGKLENNKGIFISNRKIKLEYLTNKDKIALQIGKKNQIKNYALSFVNNVQDIKNFNRILGKENKIFKLETKSAMRNLESILKEGKNFLIDRGDLSKEIGIENIPVAQRKILKLASIKKKDVYIATNFLESMVKKNFPTRAEVNDIFNALELGSKGIVLAAETAIGKYPKDCIYLVKKIFRSFKKI